MQRLFPSSVAKLDAMQLFMVCYLRNFPDVLHLCHLHSAHFPASVKQELFQQVKLSVDATAVLDDYAICRGGGFGRAILLCDVDDTLAMATQQKLISLLSDLQRSVKCNCESGCRRRDGNDR